MFLGEAGQSQPLMGEDRGDTYKKRKFRSKNRGNKREMAVILRFLRKKSSKNLQVSIIYPNFAADFV